VYDELYEEIFASAADAQLSRCSWGQLKKISCRTGQKHKLGGVLTDHRLNFADNSEVLSIHEGLVGLIACKVTIPISITKV
jgi:hypothetical protein